MQSPMPNARATRRLTSTVKVNESVRESKRTAQPRTARTASVIVAPPSIAPRDRVLDAPPQVFGLWVMGAMYHRPPPAA